MGKKSKFAMAMAGIGLCVGSAFMLGGCNWDKNKTTNEQIYAIYETAVDNGYTGTYQEWLDSIKGEKGAKGDPGKDGKDGSVVTIGEDGYWYIDGVKTDVLALGKNGADGQTPTISISTDGYWVINGAKTDTLAKGTNGSNGKSAYELAKENGFVGTEQEWLDSLNGTLRAQECLITYDFNLSYDSSLYNAVNQSQLFVQDNYVLSSASQDAGIKFTQSINKGDNFELYDFSSCGLADYFDGWYVGDVKISNIDIVAKNIELQAKWKEDIVRLLSVYSNSQIGYRYSDTDLTATAEFLGREDEMYDGKTYYNFNTTTIPELVIHDNKFYKVTSIDNPFAVKRINNEYIIDSVYMTIYLPKTISASCVKHLLNYDSYSSEANNNLLYSVFYGDVTYYASDGYVDNLVFKDGCVYEVDWDNDTAKLIGFSGLKMCFDNRTLFNITDFTTIKDGKKYSFKVTGIENYWLRLSNLGIDNSIWKDWNVTAGETGEMTMNIVLSDSVQNFAKVDDGKYYSVNIPQMKERSWNSWIEEDFSVNINWNIFMLNVDAESLNVDSSYSDSEITIYLYSKKRPSDDKLTTGKYWHYDTDGVTPVIWTAE